MARRGGILACLLLVLQACGGGGSGEPDRRREVPPDPPPSDPVCASWASAAPLPPFVASDTLVLYDDTGDWGCLGETYAIAAGHLASHFGSWDGRPVREYQAGEMRSARAVVYVGSTYDAPLPDSFLDDVLAGGTPVLWVGYNVWALERRDPGFSARYGFTLGVLDQGQIASIRYKGRELTRSLDNAGGILECDPVDLSTVTVLATAVRGDGSELPWALRSGDLTYVAENPFAYLTERDRYLAFADLLFDALAPETAERHRALVRIEDVTPIEDPARLRQIADVLYGLGVPFSVAVVPVYLDPLGVYNGGNTEVVFLSQATGVVEALAYMVERGGELVLHGYTHQYAGEANPYTGVSGDDFEFWLAHVDGENRVIHDGPIPFDSAAWAQGRVLDGLAELAAAGLPPPFAFEYPHYAGSAVDSRAIAEIVSTAYHRGLYFPGTLSGRDEYVARLFGQLFPYDVTDVYGWRVIPENLGNYQPDVSNAGVEVRLVDDLVRNADANLVVRDGFASFFFHPFFEPEILGSVVTGIQGLGYEFVSPSSL